MDDLSFKKCFIADLRRVIPGLKIQDYFSYFLFDAGYQAVVLYRLARYFRFKKFPPFNKGIPFLHRILFRMCIQLTACEISYYADIDEGFCIAHSTGIVIGAGVRIGKNVTVYSNVTIGARATKATDDSQEGKPVEEIRYPVIGDNVIIYSGARIVGGITIGENSVVGANAVVLSSFPPNSKIVGVPAKDVSNRMQGNRD